ncbi:MAG: tRNA lysidine(34) synthetase TilS, partial [Anaerotignum sp.]|nr:tRNA lysidine(34) synthetase TilS [Anaerotignum sp.]
MEKFHMFPRNGKIIVGLSGGADSVALLHVLCGLKEEFQWEITAVHIHHGLRGEEADGDASFAEAFCEKLGVSCIVRKYDVKAEAEKRKMGEEETGRLLRYEVFRELAGVDGRIAVAHHRKDQAETLLMRLCRGTGLTGLVGMAPVRENICRPLLFCSREEIEQYCKEHGLAWREDASNQEEKYTRNKLRLKVLPVLEEVNPKAVEHISETAELLALDEDFLEQQASACYEDAKMDAPAGEVHLNRTKLQELHPAMKKRVLRKAMAEFLSADVSQVQIQALEDLLENETGKSRDFLGGIRVENQYDSMVFSLEKEKTEGYCYALPVGEEIFVSEKNMTVMAWLSEKYEVDSEDTKCFDFDKVSGKLFCRTRKPGDLIALKNGRKKIKDLFIDEKVPRSERDILPLITVGEEVLWAKGLRVSENFRPDDDTKIYLHICMK